MRCWAKVLRDDTETTALLTSANSYAKFVRTHCLWNIHRPRPSRYTLSPFQATYKIRPNDIQRISVYKAIPYERRKYWAKCLHMTRRRFRENWIWKFIEYTLGQGPVEIADADFIERRALTDNSFWLATSLTDWHDNSTEKQERTFACTYKFIAAEIDGRPD